MLSQYPIIPEKVMHMDLMGFPAVTSQTDYKVTGYKVCEQPLYGFAALIWSVYNDCFTTAFYQI